MPDKLRPMLDCKRSLLQGTFNVIYCQLIFNMRFLIFQDFRNSVLRLIAHFIIVLAFLCSGFLIHIWHAIQTTIVVLINVLCTPLYLRELLVKQANTRTLRSNTKNLLQIPLTNLKRFGDRAFCAYAPRLWNELPDNIKAADSVQNFKKQLKTLLFRKEFN